MSEAVVYLDASALVKLAVEERETAALLSFLADKPVQVTSRLAAVELSRALLRAGVATDRLGRILEQVGYREVDERIASVAARLTPPQLRTLDAVHLASALELGPELDAFICYDERLSQAARLHGLPVASPR